MSSFFPLRVGYLRPLFSRTCTDLVENKNMTEQVWLVAHGLGCFYFRCIYHTGCVYNSMANVFETSP